LKAFRKLPWNTPQILQKSQERVPKEKFHEPTCTSHEIEVEVESGVETTVDKWEIIVARR
jgi:hypothetical protein